MVNEQARLRKIGEVLIKYGFGDTVKELLPLATRIRVRSLKPEVGTGTPYRRLRLALSELGPTFIKFGHFMQTRPDLLPLEMVRELRQLSDVGDPLPYKVLMSRIESELGDRSKYIARIDESPLASGSISVKHYAKLVDGTEVVIKLQRPGVRELIETDLRVLSTIAVNAEKVFSDLLIFNFPGVVEEFRTQVLTELDFVNEGKSAELLRKNMRGFAGVSVPKIHWALTTDGILTMDFMRGVPLDRVAGRTGVNPRDVAELVYSAYIKQIFLDGFFHGDPDPQNILVTDAGGIVFLDFGLMGVLRRERRDLFMGMITAVFDRDVNDVYRGLGESGARVPGGRVDQLKDDIYMALIASDDSNPEIPENRGLEGLVAALRKNRVEMTQSSMLIISTLLSVDADARVLNPEFEAGGEIRRHLVEVTGRRLLEAVNPLKAGEAVGDYLGNWNLVPQNINDALRTISDGPIRFKLDYDNLDRLSASVDKATFRMLIAVSLIVLATQNVVVISSPIASVVVYIVGGLIGAYSLYRLLLTGKKRLIDEEQG